MMIHHVREIQLRLLAVVGILIAGMVVGYAYYEPLFEFIKAPLDGPLHYTSPAGSFTFIIKICLMIGVITALPVTVYNIIMFIQPALAKRLSRARVYLTTLASLLLAGAGAAFGFLIIIPLALRFFYKFQVDGLVALISADEYLRFVVGVIITFVLIFQLPLIISLIDHITPLQPKKLLKFEKYIIVGSVFIGVAVPFALDPTVQLLIASPIIILYNLSIGIVMLQHVFRKKFRKVATAAVEKQMTASSASVATRPVATSSPALSQQVRRPMQPTAAMTPPSKRIGRTMDGVAKSAFSPTLQPKASHAVAMAPSAPLGRQGRQRGVISDMRPASRPAPRMSPPARRTMVPNRPVAE
jgi:sec-independent protein translocase protein TatC